MSKGGISIDIPGFGARHILTVLTDYTGTLSRGGRLDVRVRELLCKLAEAVDIHVLIADTFDMAEAELKGAPVTVHRLTADRHDVQRRDYGMQVGVGHCAVLGNGNNDRLLLKTAKGEGGIAIAVDKRRGLGQDRINRQNN